MIVKCFNAIIVFDSFGYGSPFYRQKEYHIYKSIDLYKQQYVMCGTVFRLDFIIC